MARDWARFAPPDDPDPRYMRLQEKETDIRWDYKKICAKLEDPETEEERLWLEERREYLRMEMQDIQMEMERFADEGYF